MKKLLSFAVALVFVFLCGMQIAANETETFASDVTRLICTHPSNMVLFNIYEKYEYIDTSSHNHITQENYFCTQCQHGWSVVLSTNTESHSYSTVSSSGPNYIVEKCACGGGRTYIDGEYTYWVD